jgi:hypothetical protein
LKILTTSPDAINSPMRAGDGGGNSSSLQPLDRDQDRVGCQCYWNQGQNDEHREPGPPAGRDYRGQDLSLGLRIFSGFPRIYISIIETSI